MTMGKFRLPSAKCPITDVSALDPLFRTIRIEEHKVWIVPETRFLLETFQRQHVSVPGDVVLASVLKNGATWLKALLHSIVACAHSLPNSLDEKTPHSVVRTMEMDDEETGETRSRPRLMSTHLPFHALPSQIKDPSSETKIVYIVRNPRDSFVSLWKFRERLAEELPHRRLPRRVPKEDLLDSFCAGTFHGGPFPEHVLGYLRMSQRHPERVLFLTYEDLQMDCVRWVRRIGDFLGYPEDVISANAGGIAERCSFSRLAGSNVNKSEARADVSKPRNTSYFRNGISGGWREHFSSNMLDVIRPGIEEALEEKGLHFVY